MLRFTIRDLLWLMVVVGLACGWWMDLQKLREIEFKYESLLGSYRTQVDVNSELWKKTGLDQIVLPGKR